MSGFKCLLWLRNSVNKWMLHLVNGMDVVKSPDLIGGKEYKGHMKNKNISMEMLLLALMFYNT